MSDAGNTRAAPRAAVTGRPEWLAWAIGSGAFAAFNGVFAKLTTATTTETLATWLSHLLGFSTESRFLELLIRAIFFGLNLISNAIMWILFTRALTAATSTTRVSILNTSANFMVTAMLGWMIFGEKLPLGWWAGASLLIAGSVIICAREGKAKATASGNGTGDEHVADSVNLQAGDTTAKTLGAGGIEQDVLANGRFKDDPDDPDDPPNEDPNGEHYYDERHGAGTPGR